MPEDIKRAGFISLHWLVHSNSSEVGIITKISPILGFVIPRLGLSTQYDTYIL